MIEPYYASDDGRVTLYCGDCLTVMPTLEAGSVDAVVTDPPYGVDKAAWDGAIPPEVIWAELARAMRENTSCVVFGGIKYLPDVMASLGRHLNFEWVFAWYKNNAMQFGKTGFSVLDVALWFSKGGAVAKTKRRDVIVEPIIPSRNNLGHPTPKPEKVIRHITDCISAPDALVLDPFMGSGTTGVACVKTGRRFIGIEISEEYCAIAKRRIVDAMAQGRLFEVAG